MDPKDSVVLMTLYCTLNLGFPPIEAATLAYVEMGLLLPRADCGRLAMVWELKIIVFFIVY